MKINDIDVSTHTLGYVNKVKNQTEPFETPPAAEKEKSHSNDNVVFSSLSKEMQKIYKIIKDTPDIREEKVAALKKAIQEGRYSVDFEALAEKILTENLLDHIL